MLQGIKSFLLPQDSTLPFTYTDDWNSVNAITEKIEKRGNVSSGSQIPTPFWTNAMDLHISIFPLPNNSTIFVNLQNCIPLFAFTNGLLHVAGAEHYANQTSPCHRYPRGKP